MSRPRLGPFLLFSQAGITPGCMYYLIDTSDNSSQSSCKGATHRWTRVTQLYHEGQSKIPP